MLPRIARMLKSLGSNTLLYSRTLNDMWSFLREKRKWDPEKFFKHKKIYAKGERLGDKERGRLEKNRKCSFFFDQDYIGRKKKKWQIFILNANVTKINFEFFDWNRMEEKKVNWIFLN